MKRTIEIEDTLHERLEDCKYEVKEYMLRYFAENPDSSYENWQDALRYDGSDHEIIDSSTPVYYSDIDAIYYLYSSELEEAYKNAGCYNEPPDNYKQVCIYFWLEQETNEYICGDLEEYFDETVKPVIEYAENRTTLDSDILEKMIAKAA